ELFQLVFRLPVVGDDGDVAGQAQLAGLVVDLGADVVVRAIARLGALLDRFLDRLDDDLPVDALLARDSVGDGEQFQAVGGDSGHGHQASSLVESGLDCSGSGAPPDVSWGRPSSSGSPRAARRAAPRFSSSSVSTSLASASQAKGIRAVSSSPSRSMATSSPSVPASRPLKRLRPSTIRSVSRRASSPSNRSKSIRRVSGRSMPGEETSSRYSPAIGS